MHPIISIHTPRVGRDTARLVNIDTGTEFQSTRPVWGVTAWTVIQTGADWVFQSTRPVWGVTVSGQHWEVTAVYFNPHAPCGA